MSIKYFLEGGDQSTRVGRGGDVMVMWAPASAYCFMLCSFLCQIKCILWINDEHPPLPAP